MNTALPLRQVGICAAALIVGVVLDRLLLAKDSPPPVSSSASAGSANATGASSAGKLSDSPVVRVLEKEKAVENSETVVTGRKSLDAILANKDPRQRTRDLQAYINSLGPGEFGDALKRLRQIPIGNERELASRLLVAQWVQSDPDSALQFAAANRNFQYLAEDVFQQRAGSDFQTAMTQAQEIPSVELRYRALRGVLSAKADSDPAAAIQLAQTLGEFRGSEPLANIVYREWAATDPKAAAAYAAAQGQGEGWRSPVTQVVNTWTQQDPAAAANWALTLPAGDSQARSLSQVMRDWGRTDPNSTANWIHSLPTGAQRDTAIAGLAQSMVGADPQTALGWLGSMTDDASRQRALQRMSREVMARDPKNGAALLQAAGLPAEQIQQAAERRGRGGRGPGG